MHDDARLPRRVVGRPALERTRRRLVIRLHRYAEHRATSPADVRWCAHTLDALSVALESGRRTPPTALGSPLRSSGAGKRGPIIE
jgi:hypothetical protein